MSNQSLAALVAEANDLLAQFTDAELQAIASQTAGRGLLLRFASATRAHDDVLRRYVAAGGDLRTLYAENADRVASTLLAADLAE